MPGGHCGEGLLEGIFFILGDHAVVSSQWEALALYLHSRDAGQCCNQVLLRRAKCREVILTDLMRHATPIFHMAHDVKSVAAYVQEVGIPTSLSTSRRSRPLTMTTVCWVAKRSRSCRVDEERTAFSGRSWMGVSVPS